MNETNPKQNSPIEAHEIDLLVDGELDERRRTELLAAMDNTPDGWRRCALAFLEDQSWRQSCKAIDKDIANDQLTAPSPSPICKPSNRKPNDGQYRRRPGAVAKAAGALLAMAGSFLFALGLGSMIWNADQQGHLGVAGGQQQAGITTSQIAEPTNPQDKALVHDTKVVLPNKYDTVTITDKRPDGTARSIQLPAVAQNRIDTARLREAPSAIPSELAQAFEAAGHDVHRSRRLVPFRMQDGRRLVVPVDQLDVRYVENTPKRSIDVPADSKWHKLGEWFEKNQPGVDERPPLTMRFMHPGIILPPDNPANR